MEFDVEWVSIGWGRGGGGVSHTGIKYLNVEASHLKTIWGAHKSPARCEN